MTRLVSDDTWGIMTVWQEARGEPSEGKVAVAEVIQRRALERYSSDGTIAGTVLRAEQFSGWSTHDPNRVPSAKLDDTDPDVQECLMAWQRAKRSNLSCGAVLYYDPEVCTPPWEPNCREVAVIGRHRFMVPI